MGRILALSGGIMIVFAIVVFVLLNLIPGPHKNSDYLVIGAVATLVSMVVLFLILVKTTYKDTNVFFKKRR
jgi:drug/metabolite transporter superfamily protein YnfA